MSYHIGFDPVADLNSVLLILGSFPSVKSREEGFYYGNPQNRFWRMLCSFFGEEIPPSVSGKRAFLLRRGVALWDVVTACEVEGSADASVRADKIADLPSLFERTNLKAVFCNGSLSYTLYMQYYGNYTIPVRRLPSTSPANPRFRTEVWHAALAEFFPRETEGIKY